MGNGGELIALALVLYVDGLIGFDRVLTTVKKCYGIFLFVLIYCKTLCARLHLGKANISLTNSYINLKID